jgi:hypothetical protein
MVSGKIIVSIRVKSLDKTIFLLFHLEDFLILPFVIDPVKIRIHPFEVDSGSPQGQYCKYKLNY